MKKNDWNKKKFIGCILFLAMCIACSRESAVVNDLRCEYLVNPLSVDTPHPRLGWKLAGNERGLKQTAYQILVATAEKRLQEGEADLWDSGRTLSENQVSVRYAGQDLTGRKLVYWKMRIWRNGGGKPSAWSETACFGAGLTEKELQAADYIAFPEDKLPPEEKEAGITSPLLRKRFEWEKEGKALLYVNSLGYHEVYVNGAKAGEQALAPAVSQFDRRSLYLTYDVTSLLKKGSNDLVIWLGAGWYEPGLPGVVHKGPAVKALLEVNRQGEWASLIRTDGQWQCAESGYTSLGTWRPHQFGGERMDAPAVSGMKTAQLDRLKWYPVEKVNVPAHAVTPQMAENDFVAEEISPVNIRQLSDSVWIADMGKVFTGRAKIKFHNQPANREIRLHYSDHLNREATRRDERLDGEDIVNQNQYDSYRASGKSEETFCSRFNYHCFRYIQLSGLSAAPLPEDITGQVIHTGNMRQSSFQCSDTDMNAIHGLVQWTLRNLTVNGYQVDCTHQERLGYGGDGLSSAVTAQTMFSLAPTYANWLAAWSDCLRPDGGLPHTAPCPYQAGGGPYWCGFVILSPWSLYLQYGDLSSLEKYYPVMQQWLGYVEQYKVEGLLQRWPEVDYRNHGWYLGDWAAPAGVNVSDPGSVEIITNSFIRICYHTMEKIARLLGKEEDARLYAQQSDTLKTLINERCFDAGKNIYG
ncbi:MAG: family 78 glycoside hydrolase catalytic domain, partial [Tannerella sp.]|nr:family 78 glycoside hydrolase catalytic domain [Tannerella sp.]